jgi:type IV pilus assembly protein PilB
MVGEMLVSRGIITPEQLAQALAAQKKLGKKLGETLIDLGYITSKDLLWILSDQADIPFVDLRPDMLDEKLINSFPEKLLYDNFILPLFETEDRIFIAIGDPTNVSGIQQLKEKTTREVVISGAEPKKIEGLLNRFFLEQQADLTLETKTPGLISVRIQDAEAWIETTEADGRVTRKKVRTNLNLNIKPAPAGGENDGNA